MLTRDGYEDFDVSCLSSSIISGKLDYAQLLQAKEQLFDTIHWVGPIERSDYYKYAGYEEYVKITLILRLKLSRHPLFDKHLTTMVGKFLLQKKKPKKAYMLVRLHWG